MVDEPDSIVLAYLRRMDAKLDNLVEDMRDVKRRITSLEAQVANLHGDFAGQSSRMDRLEVRMERMEQRLDLLPAR